MRFLFLKELLFYHIQKNDFLAAKNHFFVFFQLWHLIGVWNIKLTKLFIFIQNLTVLAKKGVYFYVVEKIIGKFESA